MLSGYRINIISKTKLQEKINIAVQTLVQVPVITDTKAQVLVQHGIMQIGDLIALEPSDLAGMLEIDENAAQEMITQTTDMIDKGEINLAGEEEEELVAASAVPAYTGILNKSEETETENDQNKFSEAERRLREELAAFKIK